MNDDLRTRVREVLYANGYDASLDQDAVATITDAVMSVVTEVRDQIAEGLLKTQFHDDLCDYGPPGECNCALGQHYRWIRQWPESASHIRSDSFGGRLVAALARGAEDPKVARLRAQRDEFKNRAQLAEVAAADRDQWKARAEWAEARVDGQAWEDLTAERDRLRAVLGEIAMLTTQPALKRLAWAAARGGSDE